MLKATKTISAACGLLGITWDEGVAVMERGGKRGQERKEATPVARIGVDEKAFCRGHSYMTIVCNLDTRTVEYIAEGRKPDSLAEFFRCGRTNN